MCPTRSQSQGKLTNLTESDPAPAAASICSWCSGRNLPCQGVARRVSQADCCCWVTLPPPLGGSKSPPLEAVGSYMITLHRGPSAPHSLLPIIWVSRGAGRNVSLWAPQRLKAHLLFSLTWIKIVDVGGRPENQRDRGEIQPVQRRSQFLAGGSRMEMEDFFAAATARNK